MNYIVLDLEWNQPVSRQKKVKHPKYYTTMNKNVRELTGITNEDLAAGEPFAKAIESLNNADQYKQRDSNLS